jgi:hypothetical protein
MSTLSFKTLRFEEIDDNIRVYLYKIFYFNIPKSDIEKIGKFSIEKNDIHFSGVKENKAEQKFNFLISKYIIKLKILIGNKNAVYVHENSGIPLFGNGSFGIVDRGTSILEVKPITGCNLDCVYCSINEPQKATDFIVSN